jgi:hypothetical protein
MALGNWQGSLDAWAKGIAFCNTWNREQTITLNKALLLEVIFD